MTDNIVFLDQYRRVRRTATRAFAEFQNHCFQACVIVQVLYESEVTVAEVGHLLMELPPRARRIVFLQLENR
jgi:DNA-directed RNA polymerase specialized sigma24 family protein